jgi:tetratricopeptide (TPR) repeat protein
MKSRLLIRLETEIKEAPHAVAADCLRCERAAYKARIGEVTAAADELAAVQRRHAHHPNATISGWSNFAEALVAHHGDRETIAVDRMKRSYAVSKAVGLQALQALSAAWLAQFCYLRMDVDGASAFVSESMRLAARDHHAARARANLVIAQAYDEGGRTDLARSWYASARHHAANHGDDATLGTLMWTMGLLRVAALRQAAACGPVEASVGEHALLAAESTAHFDKMLGLSGRQHLHAITRAQVYTFLGRTDEALALYEEHIADALRCGMAADEGALLADRAWCRSKAGREAGARQDAAAAEGCLEACRSPVNRLSGHSRLMQFYDAIGKGSRARRHQSRAEAAGERCREHQSNLLRAMDREFAVTTA